MQKQQTFVYGGNNQNQQIQSRPSSSDNQELANQLAKQAIESGKKSMMVASEADSQLWEIISDVPRLSGVWPYLVFVFNIILPGVGTLITSCVGYSGPWSKTQLSVGLLQFGTSIFIIGWVWSIWWAFKILAKALQDKAEV